MIADFYKQYYNLGQNAPLYFWRDQNGRIEVDCLFDTGLKIIPLEIKSAETVSLDFFGPITQWNELAKMQAQDSFVVYAGEQAQTRSLGNVIGWQQAGTLVRDLETKRTMGS